MRIKIITSAVIVAIIIILIGALSIQTGEKTTESVFHVTLADPKLYENGIYSEKFEVEEGFYIFRFVPNGDSPKTLTITLSGKNFEFFENFRLKGTPHETGISEFFTWEYEGQKQIDVSENMELEIMIDPHDEIMGPVSVELVKRG